MVLTRIRLIPIFLVLLWWSSVNSPAAIGGEEAGDYWENRARVLTARTLIRLRDRGFVPSQLKLISPPRWRLEAVLTPDAPGADLWVTGLLARLMFGEAFVASSEALHGIAPREFGDAERDPHWADVPFEHRSLLRWIAGHADNSIPPDALLAESIGIAQGDVFRALTLGWDVLSSGWRANSFGRPPHVRESFPRTRRLAFMPHTPGNKFAGWYHFWGVMLYSYYMSSQLKFVPVLPSGLSMVWVGSEEFLGTVKFAVTPAEAIHRAEIGLAAAREGEWLYREASRWRRTGQLSPSLVATAGEPMFRKQIFTLKAPLRDAYDNCARRLSGWLQKLGRHFSPGGDET